jgi:acetyltransferase EpsM
MSPPRDLIVVGGGGHARVVVDVARSRPELWNVVGFVDTRRVDETATLLGVPQLGDDADARSLVAARGVALVLGVGSVGVSDARASIVARYAPATPSWASPVHARAWVSPAATLGAGVVVSAGAIINAGARLGDHVVVNTGAIVEHDVQLGDFTQAAPGATIGGGAIIGERCYLGLGCRIRDHVRLGDRVAVGMGAVVVKSAPDACVLIGCPARPVEPGGRP